MEKSLFHILYDRLRTVNFRAYPPDQLSGFLHGYLTVYTMVRIYPWLAEQFGTPHDIHERAKEIARWYEVLVTNKTLPVDTRAGYAADLMDAYQLYSDANFLYAGIEAAYDILPTSSCRTPNMCRMLCNCYYFTGDEECRELAGRLVTKALGYTRGPQRSDFLAWWEALCHYDNVVGGMGLAEEERTRLEARVRQQEDEKITCLQAAEIEGDIDAVAEAFEILARREMEECNERSSIKRLL